jgi:hypothetical protein
MINLRYSFYTCRAKQTSSWSPRDDLEDIYPESDDIVLYDAADNFTRERIPRERFLELPLYNENNEPIRVFSEAGWEIPRRRARFLPTTLPFGCLLNFSRIHALFSPPPDQDEADRGYTTKYQVYPQAGLVTCGHVTANGLMTPYDDYLEYTNESLNHADGRDEETSSDDGVQTEGPVVIGIASQMYNAVMHHTRGNSSQHHGVVLGNVTAALAGHWANNTPLAHKATEFMTKCDFQLPHEEFIHKIKDRPISRDLRVESIIGISMDAIHPLNPVRNSGR